AQPGVDSHFTRYERPPPSLTCRGAFTITMASETFRDRQGQSFGFFGVTAMTFNESNPLKRSALHHTYRVMKSASCRLRQYRRLSSRHRLRCEQLEDRIAVGDVLQVFGGPLFGASVLFSGRLGAPSAAASVALSRGSDPVPHGGQPPATARVAFPA